MTERERWIVYPLLFLALGAALRDKLVDRTTTKSIVCQELSIVDEDSTGLQSQRTLFRIGRAKPKLGGKSFAYLQMNGELEIVDDDLSEQSPPPFLVKIGRTDPLQGMPSTGYAVVRGEVAVEGVIDARQYVWKHLPIVPLQVGPGAAVLGVLQAAPQPNPKAPTPNAPKTKPPSQPPASGSKKSQGTVPPSSPAGKQSPSAE
jgi:hypothetical protein